MPNEPAFVEIKNNLTLMGGVVMLLRCKLDGDEKDVGPVMMMWFGLQYTSAINAMF